MPAYSSDNTSRYWSASPPISRSNSASPLLPCSPFSTSPPLSSPISNLKRSTSNVSNTSVTSTFSQLSSSSIAPTVIITSRRQQPHRLHSRHSQSSLQGQNHNRDDTLLMKCFRWYLGLLVGIFQSCFKVIGCVFWAPTLWASAWIYLFWVILQLPLTGIKWLITILHTPASERARSKRCVLISGGSTVQSVHLARNFYKAGARVVVCEVDGLFGLARFSTACSKFYTIPRPGSSNATEYVKALKDIVHRERAVYYIPVSATNTAYYDALAKPYLESMGCECFVPRASDVTALDDPLELLRRCRSSGLQTPTYFDLRSVQDVSRLYEQNIIATGRYMMMAAGPAGMRDRNKIKLPTSLRELRSQQHDISESNPWVVIRDPSGVHFITCTTVKESNVVANVTCRIDEDRGLIPEIRADVTQWLDRFFGQTPGARINGHLSFRLAVSEDGELVPIGCRVGVSLPYVCHTGIHPRLVWKPCRHFSRQNSELLLATAERSFLSEAVANAFKQSTSEIASHLLGNVLDKREALFAYWDPLPYCAYYHLELPFRRIAGAIRAGPAQHNPPLGLVH